ncbi:MAG: restriction endonuclease subunit S [Muribaculaceae bacterium]|nr:restriction endonuclease subunit S [Muribaculaceae bacterium]
MSKWNTYRIKDVVKLISIKTDDLSLPYIALDNIVSWDATFVSSNSSSDGNSNECESGDVLFGKLRPYLAKGYIPTEKSICSPEFLVLRPEKIIHNRFLLYFLLSKSFIFYIRNQVAGVKMPRTNWTQLGSYSITLPPVEEQKVIAGYLDRECGKIDRKIELLERKDDAYSRLRRSLINRAVTRGLNPDVALKQSNLQWMPLIPGHWEIGRIRNYFNFRSEKVSEMDYSPLSVTKNGVVPQMENVAKSLAGGDSRKKVCKDDFVVNSRSDRKGSCGTSPLDGSVSLIYIVLEPKYIDPKFVDYYFRCNDWVEEFYRNGKGIVADLWTTNYSIMRNIEIAIPPIEEQQQIATYLDEKCGKIEAIIEKIGKEVERLKELKRSLINETVTGKRAINHIPRC